MSATIAALDRAPAGSAYDIVDDHPDSMSEVIAGLARTGWRAEAVQRPAVAAAPAVAVHDGLVSIRLPLSNAKARAELGWAPKYPTWREGVAGILEARGMTDVTAFDEHRPLLFSIAYRMLGSAVGRRGRRPGRVAPLPRR